GERVARVVARDDPIEQSGVADRPGHRPRVIERPGQRDHTADADAPVRRLEADDPAERGRDADRPARVAPERAVALADREGRGAAAARSAGDPREVPWVARR